MKRRTMNVSAATLATALVLAGCSSSSTDSDPAGSGQTMGNGTTMGGPGMSTDTHNAADVTFAQQMIPHHKQAIEMARLATDRAGSVEVQQLAAQIQTAQDPEIEQMMGWLTTWGETPMTGEMSMEMPGMMDEGQLSELKNAQGGTFDQLWLTMMIAHHKGAIEMARTVLDDGKDPQVQQLAQAIIDGQSAQIAEMQRLQTSD